MKHALVGFVVLILVAVLSTPMLIALALVPAEAATAAPTGQVAGLSPVLLQAYGQAVATTSRDQPTCRGLTWSVLAGIGQLEFSNGAGRTITPTGQVLPPIYGPVLDGHPGTRAIPDTDHGALDGDQVWDRAVGPMQFIPTSWTRYHPDTHNDIRNETAAGASGRLPDPHNIYDAAAAAARHLCGSRPRDLLDPDQLRQALFEYNPSTSYVEQVITWSTRFEGAATSASPAAPAGLPADADAAGVAGVGGRWVNPLAPVRYLLTSPFGPRVDPLSGAASTHRGQDLAAPSGSPVRAVCTGVVTHAGWDQYGGGLMTTINCGHQVSVTLMHQSSIATRLGATVTAGQVIGAVGSTGHSTGPHLHVQVELRGVPVNPVPFLREHGAPL